jgi:hypothetical protein
MMLCLRHAINPHPETGIQKEPWQGHRKRDGDKERRERSKIITMMDADGGGEL